MKSVILPLILFIGVSCETDIDIIPDHTKTVPIIYSIIDPYDTIQTVRIERSFIVRDKEGAKLDNPDSLYFDSVNVQLEGLSNDQIVWTIPFTRQETQKNPGDFTGQHHHIYQHQGPLPVALEGQTTTSPGYPDIDYVKLIIGIPELDTTIIAESPVFSPVIVLNNGRQSKELRLYGQNKTTFFPFAISASGENGRDCEIRFRVYINEYSEHNTWSTCVEWFTNRLDGGYLMTPERFYNRLMMGLSRSDTILVRILKRIDVEMTVAGISFSDFTYRVIWEGMIEEPATNIKGAIGFFSTKSKGELNGMHLDRVSLDSLCFSEKWKDLKFRHW